MKKLMKIAELIVDYYGSKYYACEILKHGVNDDNLDVVFYSYLEPEIGYFTQYDSEGAIEVEHLDDIKKEAPVLYREIKDLIDEELMELEVVEWNYNQ